MPDSNGDERLLHRFTRIFVIGPMTLSPLLRNFPDDVSWCDYRRGYRVCSGRRQRRHWQNAHRTESDPVYLDFSFEAKCYVPAVGGRGGNSVRTGGTKRLISRLKHRQFGVLVTTSFVARQAYKEIREDGHPVIIVSGADIVSVLKRANYSDKDSLEKLLASFWDEYDHFGPYQPLPYLGSDEWIDQFLKRGS